MSWSVSPLPVGGGFVDTDHGKPPVPAPATQLFSMAFALLMMGLVGSGSHRPVLPSCATSTRRRIAARIALTETGHGFGTGICRGWPMCSGLASMRSDDDSPADEQIAVIEFMVDDQTPEDLAMGLDALRDQPGVLEVLQAPVVAKKGRMGQAIQVITDPGSIDDAIEVCFEETTTIGLRYRFEHRKVLPRSERANPDDVVVKVVTRPGGHFSAKADMDDLDRGVQGHRGRERLREQVESAALPEGDHE